MADSKQETRRITDFSNLGGFAESDAPGVITASLIGKEIQIMAIEDKEITTPDGNVPGVAFLFTDVESGEIQKSLTFSVVLIDQLHSVPEDGFPVRGQIQEGGKGSRKYLTFT